MGDADTDQAGSTAMLRQLRQAIAPSLDDAPEAGWRDDIRLFAFTWAAGFLFFLIVFA